jgi:hypothetical protein
MAAPPASAQLIEAGSGAAVPATRSTKFVSVTPSTGSADRGSHADIR